MSWGMADASFQRQKARRLLLAITSLSFLALLTLLNVRILRFYESNLALLSHSEKHSEYPNRRDDPNILFIFDTLHEKLVRSDNHTDRFSAKNVATAVQFSVSHASLLDDTLQQRRTDRHALIRHACDSTTSNATREILDTGAWCLQVDPSSKRRYVHVDTQDNHTTIFNYTLAKHHVSCSRMVLYVMLDLIEKENITSILDLGAGIGQYKYEIQTLRHPQLPYTAYDGAANVEEYTQGAVRYADLTMPLPLADRADWILSLEVGEHVTPAYEGMFVRNLHLLNCRGIVLSWAIPGQGGHGHVNEHSNEYIVDLFEQLNYTWDREWTERFRFKRNNYGWFRNSIFVFRRKHAVC